MRYEGDRNLGGRGHLVVPFLYIVLHRPLHSKQLNSATSCNSETMEPRDKESRANSLTSDGPADENQNTTSANTQDQTLLKALQDLIVRVMDPKQMNDTNQIHLGPEAGKLIIALQEFISSIVTRSQSGTQNRSIEEGWDEEEYQLLGVTSMAMKKMPNKRWNEARTDKVPLPSQMEIPFGTLTQRGIVTLEKPQPIFEEKLLRALREHVLNQMPIRLLCFEPHASGFRITLLERDAIYERLASTMQRKMYEKELRPRYLKRERREESDEEVIKRSIYQYARYAILSHTWLRTVPGEVIYGDWNKGFFNSEDLGYRKLVNFCKAAWKNYQVTFGWMDTICINKESSSELDESIRSMYNWYERAAVCITYLAETETLPNMHLDPWFTRGWTLQELLAPRVIKFYNSHWQRLVDHSDNDKAVNEITNQIDRATTISKDELKDIRRNTSISRRMQMAATRKVTREEDTAYSLMGIFNVSISTAYGEGAERAFLRLLQEIMASSKNALEVLNWAGNVPPSHHDNPSAFLPTSPKCYIKRSSNRNLRLERPIKPLTLSHLGLHISVILMPGIRTRNTELVRNSIGDYQATVELSPVSLRYRDKNPTIYNLLDQRISDKDGWNDDRQWHQMTFAVFNFRGGRNVTSLPKTCIALGLECSECVGEVSQLGGFHVIRTEEPIVFQLWKPKWDKETSDWSMYGDDLEFWRIPTAELAQHGMQLISLYL